MANVHTIDELRQLQAMPLSVKVAMSMTRIRAWIYEFGQDGVYVSFSGGKDSTVLLHLVRSEFPNVPAVFVDTGLEYPEIREFVKTFDNVVWLKPKMNFKAVIEKYGYPFISKDVSHKLGCVQKNPNSKFMQYFNGTRTSSIYDATRWRFMLDAPFRCENVCCTIMKKQPVKKYAKETGRVRITGQMADEGRMRLASWLKYGCNGFELKDPASNPLSFWTEQDVLRYIKENNLPIASVYGDIVTDYGDELEGQMDISELGLAADNRPLRTTGCKRTGCMFCGYGCHLEKEGEGRFEMMKKTHPKQYDYIMRPKDQGGLNYKEVIDWINEHGNLHIRY